VISKTTITTIATLIAYQETDRVTKKIENSLRNAFKNEKISKSRVDRILGKFVEGLRE